MLTETFVAAIQASDTPIKEASNPGPKDGSIFVHSYQPHFTQRAALKKSNTGPNALAVSDCHIFAAQVDKAVINVYKREHSGKGQASGAGSLEAVVPIQERAGAIALAAGDAVLVIGTESGRVLLWETSSGRIVSSSTSHLQSVTAVTVSASSDFVLTGSADANIHVFSLPSLLSFSGPSESRNRLRTLSSHRGPITALAIGHTSSTASIAVSTSEDKTAIVWDHRNGTALRTYLLGDIPKALVLDPADRACFTAYEDGSVQCLDFFDSAVASSSPPNPLYFGQTAQSLVEPTSSSRWRMVSGDLGAGTSLALSWDGTKLYSGHTSGKIASWDVGVGSYATTVTTLPGKVSNIILLPPSGFTVRPLVSLGTPKVRISSVVKPRLDAFVNSTAENDIVPRNYSISVKFEGSLYPEDPEFQSALEGSTFPESLISEGLAEIAQWNQGNAADAAGSDALSLEAGVPENSTAPSLAESQRVKDLQQQLESLRRVQKVTFRQLAELREEREYFIEREEEQDRKRLMKQKMEESARVNGADSVGET